MPDIPTPGEIKALEAAVDEIFQGARFDPVEIFGRDPLGIKNAEPGKIGIVIRDPVAVDGQVYPPGTAFLRSTSDPVSVQATWGNPGDYRQVVLPDGRNITEKTGVAWLDGPQWDGKLTPGPEEGQPQLLVEPYNGSTEYRYYKASDTSATKGRMHFPAARRLLTTDLNLRRLLQLHSMIPRVPSVDRVMQVLSETGAPSNLR